VQESTNPCFDKSLCRATEENGPPSCLACPQGFKGDGVDCVQAEQDPCDPLRNPCRPGSACSAVNGVATCGPCPLGRVCISGEGLFPVSDPCQPNPCFSGVQCVAVWRGEKATHRCGLCPDGKNINFKFFKMFVSVKY